MARVGVVRIVDSKSEKMMLDPGVDEGRIPEVGEFNGSRKQGASLLAEARAHARDDDLASAYFRLVSNDTKADFGYFVIINAGGIICWTTNFLLGFNRSR
jgi:hypothetical protein